MTGAAEEMRPWKLLEHHVTDADADGARELLRSLPDGEAAQALSRLDEETRAQVLAWLPPEEAAALIDQLPAAHAVEAIEEMPPETAASIIQELPSDERADLLVDVVAPQAEAILASMRPEEAHETRELREYADDVAGGLMVKEYLAFPRSWTVGEVVDDIGRNAERYRDYLVQYAFVTDRAGRLLGVLRLRDLLLAPRDRRIDGLMVARPLTVPATATLDDLRAFFRSHAFFGVPVLDEASRLVGVVRRADVEEARADRARSDYLKAQGIVGGEELRSMPSLLRARRRLSWLSVNIMLNVIAASIIAFYQETLAAAIALAVFLPIISDMSGCTGNQAVAVSMRELALGLVRPDEALRVWGKELAVGAVNGVVLGALIGGVAWLWQGNFYLGFVVGVAMALNTLVAVSIGGTVPLLLRRLRMDPALASGPILTTITDMCGFFLVLSIASAMLARL